MIRRSGGPLVVVGLALLVSLPGAFAAEPASGDPPQLTKADVEAMMESLSNWGRWGKDDQLGTLNLITPEKRVAAARLVTDGVTISMARDLVKNPSTAPSAFSRKMIALPGSEEITYSGDQYTLAYHGYSQTHLDALCHLFYKGKMYNGFTQSEVTARGAAKLSVANMQRGIFTRCVLMDMPRLFGVRYLKGGRAIYPRDLEAWEKQAGVKVESGDAVLIRTGSWDRSSVEGPWDLMNDTAGLHASCLPWLKESRRGRHRQRPGARRASLGRRRLSHARSLDGCGFPRHADSRQLQPGSS